MPRSAAPAREGAALDDAVLALGIAFGAAAGFAIRLAWERRRRSGPAAHEETPSRPEAGSAPPPRETPASPSAGPAPTEVRSAPRAGPKIASRILLHIYSQGRMGPNDVAPVGLSQTGLSEALGATQSSIAKVLQRLVAAGVLTVSRRHVSGQGRRLLVYELTPLGEALARDLRRSQHPGPGAPPPPNPPT